MPTPRSDLTPVVLAAQRVDVAAPAADHEFVPADNINGNQVDCTGKEILEVHNTAGTAGTVTIAGVADPFGRDGSITAYSVPPFSTAEKVSVFGPFPSEAFAQTDGKLYINASAATLLLRVLRIP